MTTMISIWYPTKACLILTKLVLHRHIGLSTRAAARQCATKSQSAILLEVSWIKYRGADFLWLAHNIVAVAMTHVDQPLLSVKHSEPFPSSLSYDTIYTCPRSGESDR
jgi:hypothetical protein